VTWTQRVLRDYVLGELKPNVVVNWLTEPDHIQHGIRAGCPAARAAIRNDDREIGLLIDRSEPTSSSCPARASGTASSASRLAGRKIPSCSAPAFSHFEIS
jgi:hypothetical protein